MILGRKFLEGYDDLKKKLLFILGAIIIYRFGSFIPLPGVNVAAVSGFLDSTGGITDFLNMFTGGSLGRMTIFTLNIFPYITSSIIISLLVVISPKLKALRKDGEAGRIKINQYTRYLTVLVCTIQAFGVAVGLENLSGEFGTAVVNAGPVFRMTTVITLLGGSILIMWIAEQMTQKGLGQGASMILTVGIISMFPSTLFKIISLLQSGQMSLFTIIALALIAIAMIAFVVFIETSQRRIPIYYPRHLNAQTAPQQNKSSYLPLKVNMSGVMGPVFASSIMMAPVAFLQMFPSESSSFRFFKELLAYASPTYILLFAFFITVFAFLYTSVISNSKDMSEQLAQSGAYIPGVRPGINTEGFLKLTSNKLTVIGSLYLVLLCISPIILSQKEGFAFVLGGTTVLILANVILDFVTQLQTYLQAYSYKNVFKQTQKKKRFVQRI